MNVLQKLQNADTARPRLSRSIGDEGNLDKEKSGYVIERKSKPAGNN